MKNVQFISLLFLMFSLFISCNRSSSNNEYAFKTEEELRAELKFQELNSPLKYINGGELNMEYHQRKVRNGGIFREAQYERDGATVTGNLENTATLATYKDVNITLSFYSATNTKIGEQSYTIYEYLKPGETVPIRIRLQSIPEATAEFSYQINNASPVY